MDQHPDNRNHSPSNRFAMNSPRKKLYLTFFLLVITALSSAAAQISSAKVLSVEGTVTKYSKDGGNSRLNPGEVLVEGDSVSATAMSSARLVFSNGSLITVEENTSFEIAKLAQEPFSGSASYEQLQADPSASQTLLELNYGELGFHVKKLREDSTFNIQSPLGTAAIRGTQGSVRLIYDAEQGAFLFFVKNSEGRVDIISRYAGGATFGSDNVGNQSFDSEEAEETTEPIPQAHTLVIRLSRGDPLFDELFQAMQNFIPTETPQGRLELPLPQLTPRDASVMVISPDGPRRPINGPEFDDERPPDDVNEIVEPVYDDEFPQDGV